MVDKLSSPPGARPAVATPPSPAPATGAPAAAAKHPPTTIRADQNVVPAHNAPKFDPATAVLDRGTAKKSLVQFMDEALYPKHKADEGPLTAIVKFKDRNLNRASKVVDTLMPFKKSVAAAATTGAVVGGLIGLIGGPPGVVLGAMIGGWLGGKIRSNVHEAIAEGAARSGLQESKLDAVVNHLVPPSSTDEKLKNLKNKYDAAVGKLHLKLMILKDIQKLTKQEVDLKFLGPDPVPSSAQTPRGNGPVVAGVPGAVDPPPNVAVAAQPAVTATTTTTSAHATAAAAGNNDTVPNPYTVAGASPPSPAAIAAATQPSPSASNHTRSSGGGGSRPAAVTQMKQPDPTYGNFSATRTTETPAATASVVESPGLSQAEQEKLKDKARALSEEASRLAAQNRAQNLAIHGEIGGAASAPPPSIQPPEFEESDKEEDDAIKYLLSRRNQRL